MKVLNTFSMFGTEPKIFLSKDSSYVLKRWSGVFDWSWGVWSTFKKLEHYCQF